MASDLSYYEIPKFFVPMQLDTLIKVGMLADVEGHGEGLPIEGISISLCPRRDPAAEGADIRVADEQDERTAVEVGQVEAVMLPYAVFDFGSGGWGYGRQIRRVYNEDGSDLDA